MPRYDFCRTLNALFSYFLCSEFKEAFPAGRFRPVCKIQAKRGASSAAVADQIKLPEWPSTGDDRLTCHITVPFNLTSLNNRPHPSQSPFVLSSPYRASRQPTATPALSKHGRRRVEINDECRFEVLGATKELGPTWPQPVVKDDSEWFKHHPPDAPPPRISLPHSRAPETTRICVVRW